MALKKPVKTAPVTIEHNAYIFWEPFVPPVPYETVGDAFEKAGGQVEYDDTFVYVRGLDLAQAKRIAYEFQADYIGPMESSFAEEPQRLKDVTPKAIPVFSR